MRQERQRIYDQDTLLNDSSVDWSGFDRETLLETFIADKIDVLKNELSQLLEEIKSNLEEIRDIAQQGINYQVAVNYLHSDFDYDSVKVDNL